MRRDSGWRPPLDTPPPALQKTVASSPSTRLKPGNQAVRSSPAPPLPSAPPLARCLAPLFRIGGRRIRHLQGDEFSLPTPRFPSLLVSKVTPEEKMRRKGLAFAEKQLKKHGWKKGKGLGKQEDGISEAIKVKVKCDTAGVGHHPSEEFTFHWWDHLFNASAANVAVEAGKDGVRVRKVAEQDGSVTNKKPRKAQKNKDMLYGRFVKAATLKSGGEEPLNPVSSSDSSSDEDEKLDLSTARRLTDEELVQACGGRTAHKGARHGLTMSAKLARLEAQEKAFLATHLHLPKAKPGEEKPTLDDRRGASPARKRKKAKKRDKKRWVEPGSPRALEGTGEEESARGAPKEKKKKRKRKHQEEGGGFAAEATEEAWTGVAGRRRKATRKAD